MTKVTSMLCAMAVSVPALAHAALPPDDAPVPVKYKMTRVKGDVLLSGELGVRPGSDAQVERHAASGPERQGLTVKLQPIDDGRLSVQVFWVDQTPEGEEVKWSPAFVTKRGAEVELKLDFPGGGRVLRVTAG